MDLVSKGYSSLQSVKNYKFIFGCSQEKSFTNSKLLVMMYLFIIIYEV